MHSGCGYDATTPFKIFLDYNEIPAVKDHWFEDVEVSTAIGIFLSNNRYIVTHIHIILFTSILFTHCHAKTVVPIGTIGGPTMIHYSKIGEIACTDFIGGCKKRTESDQTCLRKVIF